MEKPTRNSPWSRDELILALDLYATNPANPPGKGSVAVADLSSLLNKMHRLNDVTASPTLRNENGVYLNIMNVRALDPTSTSQGKVGMQSGGALEKVVWADYDGERERLATDAKAIREIVAAADEGVIQKLPPAVLYEGEEGGTILWLHKRYEHDPKLIAEKRKAAAAPGKLACEICGFDFEEAYADHSVRLRKFYQTNAVYAFLSD